MNPQTAFLAFYLSLTLATPLSAGLIAQWTFSEHNLNSVYFDSNGDGVDDGPVALDTTVLEGATSGISFGGEGDKSWVEIPLGNALWLVLQEKGITDLGPTNSVFLRLSYDEEIEGGSSVFGGLTSRRSPGAVAFKELCNALALDSQLGHVLAFTTTGLGARSLSVPAKDVKPGAFFSIASSLFDDGSGVQRVIAYNGEVASNPVKGEVAWAPASFVVGTLPATAFSRSIKVEEIRIYNSSFSKAELRELTSNPPN